MPTEASRTVFVVLDPDFGDRLPGVPAGTPVWITMSSVNEPVVRALWQTSAATHLTGITGLAFKAHLSPEVHLLDELEAIDLHHGPYSTDKPYTKLKVIGAVLTPEIRAVLSTLGFAAFVAEGNGFVAERSQEEAERLRQ
ncbi:MAG TPA: hypothetical protein VNR39_10040 [Pseudolabrys sp.]|nr:hypothetical protein [Pseudolabrys sp.]